MSETTLVKELLLYLQQRRDVVCWRNNVGGGQMGGRYVKFGIKGHADIHGILTGGRFLAVEAKVYPNKQNSEQIAFQKQVEMQGGLYILAYGVEDAHGELPEYNFPIRMDFKRT